MRRIIAIAALLFAATAASAADTDLDLFKKQARRVEAKNRLCTCDTAQFYGRIGWLAVSIGGAPSAKCHVPFFDAFGKIYGGAACSLFTVLP
jgi:hypothetical protein